MTCAYDEIYLNDAQKNLGFFFQFLLFDLNLSPEEAQEIFLSSEIPYQIEIGNPDYLCGKSGYELALIALKGKDFSSELLDEKIREAIKLPFFPQEEYWSGFVLAYIQWKNNISFKKILESFSLERFLSNYHLMHEADISKMEELVRSCM